MKYRGLLFLIVLLTFLSVTPTMFGATDEKKGIVLIIANSKYSDAADKLPNAVRDGEKIEKTFKQLNFEVITRKNLSNKEDIINSLFHFAEVARNKKYETAIIYYTGHGMSANVGNVTENFLIPTKASIVTPSDIIDKCPTLSNVTDILDKNTGSKNKIIFFDACRSMESFETSYRGLFSRGSNASNSISTKSYDKIWIYYSASEGQKAYDGPKDGNSPFCDALSYYSLKPDLSVADLGNNISDYVVNYCNQHNLNEQTPVLQQSGPMLLSLNPAKNTTEKDDSFTSQNVLSILKNKKENQTDIYAGIGYGKSGYNYPYFSLGINLNDHLPVLKSLNIEIDCAFPYNSQTSVYWMPNEGTNSLSGVWDYKKQYILFTELGYRMSLSNKKKFYLTPQLGISMEQYKGDAQNSTEYSLQHSWSLFMNARTKFDYYISNHILLFGIAHYDIFPFKYGKIAQTLEDGANLINDWNKGLYIKRLSLIFGIGYNF